MYKYIYIYIYIYVCDPCHKPCNEQNVLSMSLHFSVRGILTQPTFFFMHGTPSARTLKTLPVWTLSVRTLKTLPFWTLSVWTPSVGLRLSLYLNSVCHSVCLDTLCLSLCLYVWTHLSGGCRTCKNNAV